MAWNRSFADTLPMPAVNGYAQQTDQISGMLLTGAEWCSIVVPCFNEEQRLRPQGFSDYIALGSRVRFIFVNDGSTDRTLQILQELRAANPDSVHILDLQLNGGKAEAVRAGILQAVSLGGSACVGFWDADGATPLDALGELLGELARQPQIEMVFGSRVCLLGRRIHRKPFRHYLGRAFASVVSLMLRLPIYDTQCGAKIFRVTPNLLRIMNAPFHSRWIFDVEIIARLLALNGRNHDRVSQMIYEYPLHEWTDVSGSKVKATVFLRAIIELLQIWQNYLR